METSDSTHVRIIEDTSIDHDAIDLISDACHNR